MEWISVKDKLPENETEVICFQPSKNAYRTKQTWAERVLVGYLFKIEPFERHGRIDHKLIGDKEICLNDGGVYWAFPYICHQSFVTHWMPLPEPPTKNLIHKRNTK